MIEEIGKVARVGHRNGNSLITIAAKQVLKGLRHGDSIAIDGVCLTVVSFDANSVSVEATSHTLAQSTLNEVETGRHVNLELALKLGDRLGGHIVQGHVDGVGRVSRIQYKAGSTEVSIELDRKLLALMAPNGSVAVNGVSLTITEKSNRGIKLVIIPSTLEMTTFGEMKPGNRVNIESDLIIRWMADRYGTSSNFSPDENDISDSGRFHLED